MIDKVSALNDDSFHTRFFPRPMTVIKVPYRATIIYDGKPTLVVIYRVVVIPKANVKKVRLRFK